MTSQGEVMNSMNAAIYFRSDDTVKDRKLSFVSKSPTRLNEFMQSKKGKTQ